MENVRIWKYSRTHKENKKTTRNKALKKFVVRFSGTVKKSHEYGGVAQLGEHLPCKQGVKGSIPFISTIGCKTENVVHKELKQRSKVNLGCAKQ